MELGMIGMGRMGSNMAQRLLLGGHNVLGFDPNQEARMNMQSKGIECLATLNELLVKLPTPRVLWLMVPAGEVVDKTIEALLPLLIPGDTLIDGGNSNYKHSQSRAKMLAEKKIFYIDCGTSGGMWGLKSGYSLMIGGDKAAAENLRPIFETLAPENDHGWGHVGPSGAGHFTKMIHNGIEYGLMQAYAEGFSIMQHKTELTLDLHQVAEIWRHGSVVRSWLLDLTSAVLEINPAMNGIAAYVEDSGEGRWTVAEAIDLNVSAPVITMSLLERLRSRDPDSFSNKLLAAMRNQFGGHAIKKE